MKKQDKYYLINLCHNGMITTIRCETKKEKDKWLYDHFTVGNEKWWAWEQFQESYEKTFDKFVKKLIKKEHNSRFQTFALDIGEYIIIQEKNKEKVGK